MVSNLQGNSVTNIETKCNSLTQQFIRISTTIDTWATCFDSIESSSGPQRLQIQLLQGGQVQCGIPNAYTIVSILLCKHWGSHSALDRLVIIGSVVFEVLKMTR